MKGLAAQLIAFTGRYLPGAAAGLLLFGALALIAVLKGSFANDVSRPDSGFGSDTNRVWFVSESDCEELPTLGKDEVARRLMQRVACLANAR